MLREREAARVMGVRAGHLVRKEFDLQITVARYADAYTALMNESARNHPRKVHDGTSTEIPLQEARP
jgi:hypothetical protein